MEIKECKNYFLGCCHLYMDGVCNLVKTSDCPIKKEAADSYTRKWMRQCLEFWQRQYREAKWKDEIRARKLSYEEACIMTAGCDCPVLWTGKPYWKPEPYTREQVVEMFNSEFSEDFEKCMKKYCVRRGGPYKIIPNYRKS